MGLVFFYKFIVDSKVIYVGSTTNFDERKRLHHLASKTDDKLVYKTIRDLGGWANVSMCLIEHAFCVDREHRRAREQYWLNEYRSHDLCNRRKAYVGGVAL